LGVLVARGSWLVVWALGVVVPVTATAGWASPYTVQSSATSQPVGAAIRNSGPNREVYIAVDDRSTSSDQDSASFYTGCA
jgi:hypothetical protein